MGNTRLLFSSANIQGCQGGSGRRLIWWRLITHQGRRCRLPSTFEEHSDACGVITVATAASKHPAPRPAWTCSR